jgi:hypothetical protein
LISNKKSIFAPKFKKITESVIGVFLYFKTSSFKYG